MGQWIINFILIGLYYAAYRLLKYYFKNNENNKIQRDESNQYSVNNFYTQNNYYTQDVIHNERDSGHKLGDQYDSKTKNEPKLLLKGSKRYPSLDEPVNDRIEDEAIHNDGVVQVELIVNEGEFTRTEVTKALNVFVRNKKCEMRFAKNGTQFYYFPEYGEANSY